MNKSVLNLLSELQESIDGINVSGSCAVQLPIGHVACGILIEQTGRKNEVYIWSMTAPIFSPMMKRISLNYSERISENSFLLESGSSTVKDTIVATINEKFLERWRRMADIHSFAEEFVPRGDFGRPNIALELAIATGLAGDIEKCKTRLAHAAELGETTRGFEGVVRVAMDLMISIDNGNFTACIETIEMDNLRSYFKGVSKEV